MARLEPDDVARHGIFRVGSHLVGLPADAIEDIFILPPLDRPPGARKDDDPLVAGSLASRLVRRLAQWTGAQGPVLIVDHGRIVTGAVS